MVPTLSGEGAGLEEINQDNQLIMVSLGLGTSAHIDPNDGGLSLASWSQASLSQKRVEPEGWWFLFPDVGLAIKLCDGVLISWDGRTAAHATCVPWGVPDGDSLCALFMGVSLAKTELSRREAEFRRCQTARCLGCRGGELCAGELVWVRWNPPSRPDHPTWRRRSAMVVSCAAGGGRLWSSG